MSNYREKIRAPEIAEVASMFILAILMLYAHAFMTKEVYLGFMMGVGAGVLFFGSLIFIEMWKQSVNIKESDSRIAEANAEIEELKRRRKVMIDKINNEVVRTLELVGAMDNGKLILEKVMEDVESEEEGKK
jgi:hypothetical protein